MLKCKDIATLSSDYLADDLGTGQRLKFVLHLAICGNCRTFVRHFRLMLAMMRQKRPTVLGEDAAREISQRAIRGQD